MHFIFAKNIKKYLPSIIYEYFLNEVMSFWLALQERPKVFLTPEQLLMEKYSTTTPIIFTLDIQHLLLYSIQGNISSYKPR